MQLMSCARFFRLAIAILSIGGINALLNACYADNLLDIYTEPLNNPLSRQVRFNLAIENPTGKTLTDQTIWFYVPVKRTATQYVQKLEVSAPYSIDEDALGNQLIRLNFDQFAPFSTELVSIRVDLLVSSLNSPSRLIDASPYLDEERYIEKDDLVIQRIASIVKSGQTTNVVDGIYQWVRTNMSYAGYIADDLGARYAAENMRGDCTEYAYLVAALARQFNSGASAGRLRDG